MGKSTYAIERGGSKRTCAYNEERGSNCYKFGAYVLFE